MLIEFSVKNFLSFREKQVFSMVASKDSSLQSNIIPLSLPGLSDIALLKSAVLYGANASGKSNLLKALAFFTWFVKNSVVLIAPDQPIPKVEPFRLATASEQLPSEFEMTFIVEGIRYQYGFAVDNTRVHSEWLYAYPNGKPQRWYEREYDSTTGNYTWEFSPRHFTGPKEVLKKQTRDNALFLSTAAQFNHEQLLPLYQWFQQKQVSLDLAKSDLEHNLIEIATKIQDDKETQTKISSLLSLADLGISSVNAEKTDFNLSKLAQTMPDRVHLIFQGEKREQITLSWQHKIPGSEKVAIFDTASESAGTIRYLSVLVPLLTALNNAQVLAIDELGANIHPLLVRSIFDSFHTLNTPQSTAQLIITTHDTSLLDKELLRRDQIWFTEKTAEGETRLYPLTDFHPRKEEALERGYLAGRYGAIPFLSGNLPL